MTDWAFVWIGYAGTAIALAWYIVALRRRADRLVGRTRPRGRRP